MRREFYHLIKKEILKKAETTPNSINDVIFEFSAAFTIFRNEIENVNRVQKQGIFPVIKYPKKNNEKTRHNSKTSYAEIKKAKTASRT